MQEALLAKKISYYCTRQHMMPPPTSTEWHFVIFLAHNLESSYPEQEAACKAEKTLNQTPWILVIHMSSGRVTRKPRFCPQVITKYKLDN